MGGVILLPLAGAAQLGQHVLEVLQPHRVGIVGQLYRVGHRVDGYVQHAVHLLNAILDTAGAIGSHVLFESQGNIPFLHFSS